MGSFFGTQSGVEFFNSLAWKYENQSRLYVLGKLQGEWDNVRRHCLVQAAAIGVLGDALGFPGNLVECMVKVAVLHDSRKRIDIMYDRRLRRGEEPLDFQEGEVKYFDEVFRSANPDPDLANALNPWFLPKVLAGKASFPQLVQFLADDMAKGEEIVPFDERID